MQISTKVCSRCKSLKNLEMFYNSAVSKDGKLSACKECCKEGRKKSQAKRDEHHRRVQAERHLVRKYGITMLERNEILESQGGMCAICRSGSDFVVDHCHDTGRVRGILCRTCNQGLGLLYDSIDNLSNAIKYLEDNAKSS